MDDLQSIDNTTSPELTALHAKTCLMMTRFISGHHCPKLAHVIVQQLQCLLSHPTLKHVPASREMYQQLLGHWLGVADTLLAQKSAGQSKAVYH